jgi:hypothetical protein
VPRIVVSDSAPPHGVIGRPGGVAGTLCAPVRTASDRALGAPRTTGTVGVTDIPPAETPSPSAAACDPRSPGTAAAVIAGMKGAFHAYP